MLVWSFDEFFTLAKLNMPISQQRNMIETCFKSQHIQKNELYKVGNMVGAYWGRGAYYGQYSTCIISQKFYIHDFLNNSIFNGFLYLFIFQYDNYLNYTIIQNICQSINWCGPLKIKCKQYTAFQLKSRVILFYFHSMM